MPGNFSKKYHRQTDFYFPIGKPPLSPQAWPKEWGEIHYKDYPRLPNIKLPQSFLPLDDLEKALVARRSAREYSPNENLSLTELSTLLYYAAGVRPAEKSSDDVRRFYPSGGALYPLEVYLAVQNVTGLDSGLYHYNVKEFILEALSADKEDLASLKESLLYPWSRDAGILIFITAVWDRTFIKYQDRGYRIVLLEAGHLAQNFSLISAALKIKCCPSLGFHNQRVNEILNLENGHEDSLYLILIGK